MVGLNTYSGNTVKMFLTLCHRLPSIQRISYKDSQGEISSRILRLLHNNFDGTLQVKSGRTKIKLKVHDLRQKAILDAI